jgi:thiol-disulfide isomerase/thioredoxin
MSKNLLLLFLLVTINTLSQDYEPVRLFSYVIGKNIKSYTYKSQIAYDEKNIEYAEFLFDSLITNVVVKSYMDNFKVNKLSGKKIELYDFKKPIFLMTYASWCTPGIGEIPALNKIAEAEHTNIDFIVLFWDSKDKIKKIARNYSNKINIVYIDELENNNDHVIEYLKHSLGLPTSFFIDEKKKIVDVRRGVLHQFNEEFNLSFELNHNEFQNGIALLKGTENDIERISQEEEY